MSCAISTSRRGSGRAALALLVGLLASCGGPAPPTPGPTAAGPAPTATSAAGGVRIVVLGDSLAAGLGLAEGEAFPAVLESRLRAAGVPATVVNAGVSGDTTAGGLTRLDWVLRGTPDVLVVELGANDALRGQPLAGIESNLREIVRRGRAVGAAVVLLGMDVPTSYGPDYAGGFAALYPRVAEEEGAVLVPGFMREVGLDPSLLQADGLHPTSEGQRRLAAELVPVLERVLQDVAPSPTRATG